MPRFLIFTARQSACALVAIALFWMSSEVRAQDPLATWCFSPGDPCFVANAFEFTVIEDSELNFRFRSTLTGQWTGGFHPVQWNYFLYLPFANTPAFAGGTWMDGTQEEVSLNSANNAVSYGPLTSPITLANVRFLGVRDPESGDYWGCDVGNGGQPEGSLGIGFTSLDCFADAPVHMSDSGGLPSTVVPEPSTWIMMATGLTALAFVARRRPQAT